MLILKHFNRLILQQLYIEQECFSKMFFIIEEAKETVLDFSQGYVKVL